MNTSDDTKRVQCGVPETILFDDNAKGIIAPSTTAKPFMAEDGFVESDKSMGDE